MLDGQRIRQVRKRRQLTQEQLGKLIEQDGAYISKIERGVLTSTTTTTLEKLADALRLTTDAVLGRGHNPFMRGAPEPTATPGRPSASSTPKKQVMLYSLPTLPQVEPTARTLLILPPAQAEAPMPQASPTSAQPPRLCPHCRMTMQPLDEGTRLTCPGCHYTVADET